MPTWGNHINDKLSNVTQYDLNGYPKSQTLYTNYDQYGNAQTISNWVQGSNFLSRNYTYSGGLVQTVKDVNSAPTSYGYQTCGSVQAFINKINEPGGLSRSATWYCDGGVQASSTDENGQPTSFTRNDPFWRVTTLTDPLQNSTNTVFTPITNVNQAPGYTTEVSLGLNSSSAVDVLTTLDGLGRVSLVQKRQAPGSSNFDQFNMDMDGTAPAKIPCDRCLIRAQQERALHRIRLLLPANMIH